MVELGAVTTPVPYSLESATTADAYLAAKLSNGNIVLLTQGNRAIKGEIQFAPDPESGFPIAESDFCANHSEEEDSVVNNTFFDDTVSIEDITIMNPQMVSGSMEVVLSIEQQYERLNINGITSMFSFESPDYPEIAPSNVYNL